MRCFVAVDIPEEIKNKIKEVQQEFSSFDAKLVEPKNLHFTLKFLGEISENNIESISKKLTDVARSVQPFNIQLSGMGAFPNLSYIRVVWVSALSDDFINLHKSISSALPGNNKEAKPHLTIARIRSPRGKDIIAKIIRRYEQASFGTMPVNKICLKKSTLTPRGPIYEDIKVFELKK